MLEWFVILAHRNDETISTFTIMHPAVAGGTTRLDADFDFCRLHIHHLEWVDVATRP